jgi:hypothetical protein
MMSVMPEKLASLALGVEIEIVIQNAGNLQTSTG